MLKSSKLKRTRLGGQTLAATLIVVVIILVLVVVLFKGSAAFGGKPVKARPDGNGATVLGQVRFAAKDDVCLSNLGQVRQSITIFETSNDDHPPDTLQETKLGDAFYKCPIGGEPYAYDPSTGQVHCVHPGHEKY